MMEGHLYHLRQKHGIVSLFRPKGRGVIIFIELHKGMSGGHFSSKITIVKILDAQYWWPIHHENTMHFVNLVMNVKK